ncbi:MAG: hypothetical protein V1748_03680 [Actinomycetota bacterium]
MTNEFPLPAAGSGPAGIALGADGNLWFSEFPGNRIGRITPAGGITEFAVPTAGSNPEAACLGRDGNIWFTETAGNKVGTINTAGIIKEYAVPTAAALPLGLGHGPDGSIWFTEYAAGFNQIGKVTGFPLPNWYLAEGSTAWGFDEYITVENPNTVPVNVEVTYNTSAGPVPGGTLPIAATSQLTIDPRAVVGNADFSTRLVCVEGETIAVDRTMSWTGTGAASPEGHNSVGVTSPYTIWYLPEGSSQWGFETWLLIQNPTAMEATCQVTYMIEGAAPVTVAKTVPGGSRITVPMVDDIGNADASIRVLSSVPVIPERAMYRYDKREGHDSIGTPARALNYFLAEGSTAWGFTTYVLVQNPNNAAVDVTLTYMTPSGPVVMPAFPMPANSRRTIRVNDQLPDQDVSTMVSATAPIIAERAMYWETATGEATHDSIGLPFSHDIFYLPDGDTSGGRETWTLVQNPNGSDVPVRITYMRPAGAGTVIEDVNVPANSRMTFNMSDSVPDGRAAIMVECRDINPYLGIMAERAMYWDSRGAGTDSIGGFSD